MNLQYHITHACSRSAVNLGEKRETVSFIGRVLLHQQDWCLEMLLESDANAKRNSYNHIFPTRGDAKRCFGCIDPPLTIITK